MSEAREAAMPRLESYRFELIDMQTPSSNLVVWGTGGGFNPCGEIMLSDYLKDDETLELELILNEGLKEYWKED